MRDHYTGRKCMLGVRGLWAISETLLPSCDRARRYFERPSLRVLLSSNAIVPLLHGIVVYRRRIWYKSELMCEEENVYSDAGDEWSRETRLISEVTWQIIVFECVISFATFRRNEFSPTKSHQSRILPPLSCAARCSAGPARR